MEYHPRLSFFAKPGRRKKGYQKKKRKKRYKGVQSFDKKRTKRSRKIVVADMHESIQSHDTGTD